MMYNIFRYILCTLLTSLLLGQQLDLEKLELLVVNGNPSLAAGKKQIEYRAGLLE